MENLATRLAPNDAAERLRDAMVQPSSWNERDLSFDVVWTTGAAVTRFDWWDGEFYNETLSTDPAHVRAHRLQAGGPVLVDHVGSTSALAGSIVPGSVRITKGEGTARVRLSSTPDMTEIVSKVRDGHLRTVSVGYIVHAYERTPGADRNSPDTMHAVDWEPIEISLTPVPADAGAVVRKRSEPMPPIVNDRATDEGAPYRGAPSRRRSATVEQILRACSRANVSREFERKILADHEAEPMSETELYDAVFDEIGSRRNAAPINAMQRPDRFHATTPTRSVFADVLTSRLTGRAAEGPASEYAGASLVDMARALLEEHGEPARWARASSVIDKICRAGNHATSDFSHMLTTAGERYLIETFNGVPSPLKVLARKRDFPDFRTRYGIIAEGPTALLLTPENAEFKRVSFGSTENGYQLGTYGSIFAISRQALVNDDLGVFSQMAMFWARAQANTEADYFAAMINATGATMSEDNKPLYHVDHNNIAASGSAITVEALSAARSAMRSQRNRDGDTLANVVPKYLVVGAAKETEAEAVLATINPATTGDVNPFSGKLELIVDPRITGNSWRLFADPTLHPVLEYGNLEGQNGLFTDARTGFDVDGVEFKARIDLGVGAIDYRGTYLNPGN